RRASASNRAAETNPMPPVRQAIFPAQFLAAAHDRILCLNEKQAVLTAFRPSAETAEAVGEGSDLPAPHERVSSI
ncbi:MAG: hypothetical protein AB1705_27650, partial [Verrucomicrobiota bacterium]